MQPSLTGERAPAGVDSAWHIQLSPLVIFTSSIDTSGIDVALNWGTGLGGFGNLDFTLVGTWLATFEQQTDATSPSFDFAGSIGVLTGQSLPEWKGTLITSYSYDDLHVQARTRYIGSMQHRNTVNGGSPTANTGVTDTWYVDLSGRYESTDWVCFA
jgi:iron complex outermembrane recepter protein